jgi:hypothetical protein
MTCWRASLGFLGRTCLVVGQGYVACPDDVPAKISQVAAGNVRELIERRPALWAR